MNDIKNDILNDIKSDISIIDLYIQIEHTYIDDEYFNIVL